MARFRATSKGNIPFTQEEEMEADLAEQEYLERLEKSKVPTQITPRQIRQQLTVIGLRQTAEDLISSSTDYNLKDWWEYSQDFQRSHPILKEMGEKLGMSEDDMDSFFIEASKL